MSMLRCWPLQEVEPAGWCTMAAAYALHPCLQANLTTRQHAATGGNLQLHLLRHTHTHACSGLTSVSAGAVAVRLLLPNPYRAVEDAPAAAVDGTKPQVTGPPCPPDKPAVQCNASACAFTSCAVNTYCVDTSCGSCGAVCLPTLQGSTQHTPEQPLNSTDAASQLAPAQFTNTSRYSADICPLDKPLANCLVAPCSVATCPNRTVCVADMCGGCTAQCVPQPKGEVHPQPESQQHCLSP